MTGKGVHAASTRFIRIAVFFNVLCLAGMASAQDGSSGWTRTSNPPVNRLAAVQNTQEITGEKPASTRASTIRFDWKPLTVAAAGIAVDTLSTHRFIHNGSGCVERTARYTGTPYSPEHPNFRQMWTDNAVELGVLAFAHYVLHLSRSRDPESRVARFNSRVLKIESYAVGVWRTSRGVRNVSLCGW